MYPRYEGFWLGSVHRFPELVMEGSDQGQASKEQLQRNLLSMFAKADAHGWPLRRC